MVKYLRVNFVADLDYLRWNLHDYLAERIMERHPGYGLEIVLNQVTDLRKGCVVAGKCFLGPAQTKGNGLEAMFCNGTGPSNET